MNHIQKVIAHAADYDALSMVISFFPYTETEDAEDVYLLLRTELLRYSQDSLVEFQHNFAISFIFKLVSAHFPDTPLTSQWLDELTCYPHLFPNLSTASV